MGVAQPRSRSLGEGSEHSGCGIASTCLQAQGVSMFCHSQHLQPGLGLRAGGRGLWGETYELCDSGKVLHPFGPHL